MRSGRPGEVSIDPRNLSGSSDRLSRRPGTEGDDPFMLGIDFGVATLRSSRIRAPIHGLEEPEPGAGRRYRRIRWHPPAPVHIDP
jgi:hypothetical protein